MWDHPYITSLNLPPPNNSNMLMRPHERLTKLAEKLRNSSLTPKYRAEQFLTNFGVSGGAATKRVDTCKDHWRSEALEKKNMENTVLHTHSNGVITFNLTTPPPPRNQLN